MYKRQEDEVLTDALELLPMFDDISDDEHNRFTKRDVLDAMNMYQENYVTSVSYTHLDVYKRQMSHTAEPRLSVSAVYPYRRTSGTEESKSNISKL